MSGFAPVACLLAASAIASPAEAERIPSVVLLDAGFDHFYNLEYDKALSIFDAEAAMRPSPDAYNHIAQTLVFRAMFRAGALDTGMIATTRSFLHMPKVPMTSGDEAQFQDAVAHAREMALAAIGRDPKDAHAWYALGVSRGLLGDYDLFVRKAYVDSLREANAARAAHLHATQIDPAFVDARLTQGLYDYIVGSLPFGWKLLGFLGGYHGDRERGIETLNLVARQGRSNRLDAKIILAAVYRREKEPLEAITMIQDLIPRLPRNYLLRLELAEMYADAGERDHAQRALSEIDRMKTDHAPGYDRLPEATFIAARERIMADPK